MYLGIKNKQSNQFIMYVFPVNLVMKKKAEYYKS